MATGGRPQGHTASAVMAADTEAGREASPPAAPMVDVALSVAALAPDSVETSSALFALNGDTALYQRLLAHARVFMGSWNQDLATALNAADAAPALRLAHDLQSIAARIGAHALADAAGSLDAALRFGDLEGVQRARALISHRLQEALLSPSLAGDHAAVAEMQRR
jgi:HPt (histidine-containing phosphotransfer) domain-containing protein